MKRISARHAPRPEPTFKPFTPSGVNVAGRYVVIPAVFDAGTGSPDIGPHARTIAKYIYLRLRLAYNKAAYETEHRIDFSQESVDAFAVFQQALLNTILKFTNKRALFAHIKNEIKTRGSTIR